MIEITRKELQAARNKFQILLEKPRTKESEWQKFFSNHPFILSRALPLDLEPSHVKAMGTPGKSEPDFLLYPWNRPSIPYYGVVEIKRPDSKILTGARKNIIQLSRDADTAVQQGKQYIRDLEAQLSVTNRSTICLGNRAYIFVIMGMSGEIAQRLGEQLFAEQLEGLLPRNLQLLPYDTIFQYFSDTIPAAVMFLNPMLLISEEEFAERLEEEARNDEFMQSPRCG